jgi:hypothetical protein
MILKLDFTAKAGCIFKKYLLFTQRKKGLKEFFRNLPPTKKIQPGPGPFRVWGIPPPKIARAGCD